MLHRNTLEIGKAALAIIDIQESFRGVISEFTELAARIAQFTHGARILCVPIVVTEQYPTGLGHTAAEVRAVLPPEIQVIEKTAFSSCGAQQFVSELERLGARQVIVCGIEAHICVNQTVHDLLARGFDVHLLLDCVSSRAEHNKQTGIQKMLQSGAVPSSIEMALFELMRDANHEQFKAVQRLIK